MSKNAVFIYSDQLLHYKFQRHHPFNQKRLEMTVDLLKSIGALPEESVIPPRKALNEELELFHDKTYVEVVKKAGHGLLAPEQVQNYGLGTEDTPIFKNMHEVSSLIVGGTILAAEYVMTGKAEHAANLGGGLHHAFRGKASGFCVYNDCSVAIAYIRNNMTRKFFISIRMPITGMEYSGHFTTIPMYAHCQYTKPDVTFFRGPGTSMNGVPVRVMVILSIYLWRHLRKMNPGYMLLNNPSKQLPIILSRISLFPSMVRMPIIMIH